MNKFFNSILCLPKQQDVQRFLLMGVLSNVINFAVYYALININVNLSLSSILGYLAGLICSYHLGRVWVFGQRFDINSKSILFFGIVYFLGSVWMTVIINLMVNYLWGWWRCYRFHIIVIAPYMTIERQNTIMVNIIVWTNITPGIIYNTSSITNITCKPHRK